MNTQPARFIELFLPMFVMFFLVPFNIAQTSYTTEGANTLELISSLNRTIVGAEVTQPIVVGKPITPSNSSEAPPADLSQSAKHVSLAQATAGQILDYTIVLTNSDQWDFANVILTDTLPMGAMLIPDSLSIMGARGTPISGTIGNVITVSNLVVLPTEPISITYNAVVHDGLMIGEMLTNTAVFLDVLQPAKVYTRTAVTEIVFGFSLSGNITDSNNNPLTDVTITTNNGQTATTDTNGNYTITGLITGTHTLTPTKTGITFSPPSRTITVPPSATNQNFTGTATSAKDIPIIIIPGIMGSTLRNSPYSAPDCISRPDTQVWTPLLPLYQNEMVETLFLQPDGLSPANSCDNISATGVIERFLHKDLNEELQDSLENAGYTVHPFAYDWRLDVGVTAVHLDRKVEEVLSQTGAERVILLAHSLGGLVSRQYTLDENRASKVERVITVGTPYWGAPEIAYHVRKGTISINAFNYLTSNSTMRQLHRNSPAVMQLLPSRAYAEDTPYFWVNGTVLSHDQTIDYFKSNNQNGALLNQAEARHQQLDDFVNYPSPVPYHILTANHLPVVTNVDESNCWRGTCWSQFEYSFGDGTVPWSSASLGADAFNGQLPANTTVCTFQPNTITNDHATMLVDPFVISETLQILDGAPPQYCVPHSQLNALQTRASVAADNLIQFVLRGNGRVTIENSSGQIAMVNEDGWVVNDIPNSTYQPTLESTLALLPAGQVYTVTISQQDAQPMTLQVSDFEFSNMTETYEVESKAMFMDPPTAEGAQLTLPLDLTAGLASLQLQVDLNGDGTIEETLPPTSVVTGEELEDYLAPETSITLEGTQDSSGFYTGVVTTSVAATDTGSGVLFTEYSLDGGATWLPYTEPISFIAEEVPQFEARSVDQAGNQEVPWATVRLRPHQVYLPFLQR